MERPGRVRCSLLSTIVSQCKMHSAATLPSASQEEAGPQALPEFLESGRLCHLMR
jgi:hypothetical protein